MSEVHYLKTFEHLSVPRAHSSTSFCPISTYFIHGMKICQTKFIFLHKNSWNRYLSIVALYNKEGLAPTAHGNKGELPTNTFNFEEVELVKSYIENYARAHGLPVPGRLTNARDKVLLLPSDMSKMFVYRKYREAATDPVGKSKFFEL